MRLPTFGGGPDKLKAFMSNEASGDDATAAAIARKCPVFYTITEAVPGPGHFEAVVCEQDSDAET